MPKTEKPNGIKNPFLPHNFEYKGVKYQLTPQEKAFIDNYIQTQEKIESVVLAYSLANKKLYAFNQGDLNDKDKMKRKRMLATAKQMAIENLARPHIRAYIYKYLDETGFTDDEVKRAHWRSIQSDNDASRNQAVDMYYKLKSKYPRNEVDDEFQKEATAFFAAVRSNLNGDVKAAREDKGDD